MEIATVIYSGAPARKWHFNWRKRNRKQKKTFLLHDVTSFLLLQTKKKGQTKTVSAWLHDIGSPFTQENLRAYIYSPK